MMQDDVIKPPIKEIDSMLFGYLRRQKYFETLRCLMAESEHLKSLDSLNIPGQVVITINDTISNKNLEQIVQNFLEFGRFDIPGEFIDFGARLRQLSDQFSFMTSVNPNYSEGQKRIYGKNVRTRQQQNPRQRVSNQLTPTNLGGSGSGLYPDRQQPLAHANSGLSSNGDLNFGCQMTAGTERSAQPENHSQPFSSLPAATAVSAQQQYHNVSSSPLNDPLPLDASQQTAQSSTSNQDINMDESHCSEPGSRRKSAHPLPLAERLAPTKSLVQGLVKLAQDSTGGKAAPTTSDSTVSVLSSIDDNVMDTCYQMLNVPNVYDVFSDLDFDQMALLDIPTRTDDSDGAIDGAECEPMVVDSVSERAPAVVPSTLGVPLHESNGHDDFPSSTNKELTTSHKPAESKLPSPPIAPCKSQQLRVQSPPPIKRTEPKSKRSKKFESNSEVFCVPGVEVFSSNVASVHETSMAVAEQAASVPDALAANPDAVETDATMVTDDRSSSIGVHVQEKSNTAEKENDASADLQTSLDINIAARPVSSRLRRHCAPLKEGSTVFRAPLKPDPAYCIPPTPCTDHAVVGPASPDAAAAVSPIQNTSPSMSFTTFTSPPRLRSQPRRSTEDPDLVVEPRRSRRSTGDPDLVVQPRRPRKPDAGETQKRAVPPPLFVKNVKMEPMDLDLEPVGNWTPMPTKEQKEMEIEKKHVNGEVRGKTTGSKRENENIKRSKGVSPAPSDATVSSEAGGSTQDSKRSRRMSDLFDDEQARPSSRESASSSRISSRNRESERRKRDMERERQRERDKERRQREKEKGTSTTSGRRGGAAHADHSKDKEDAGRSRTSAGEPSNKDRDRRRDKGTERTSQQHEPVMDDKSRARLEARLNEEKVKKMMEEKRIEEEKKAEERRKRGEENERKKQEERKRREEEAKRREEIMIKKRDEERRRMDELRRSMEAERIQKEERERFAREQDEKERREREEKEREVRRREREEREREERDRKEREDRDRREREDRDRKEREERDRREREERDRRDRQKKEERAREQASKKKERPVDPRLSRDPRRRRPDPVAEDEGAVGASASVSPGDQSSSPTPKEKVTASASPGQSPLSDPRKPKVSASRTSLEPPPLFSNPHHIAGGTPPPQVKARPIPKLCNGVPRKAPNYLHGQLNVYKLGMVLAKLGDKRKQMQSHTPQSNKSHESPTVPPSSSPQQEQAIEKEKRMKRPQSDEVANKNLLQLSLYGSSDDESEESPSMSSSCQPGLRKKPKLDDSDIQRVLAQLHGSADSS